MKNAHAFAIGSYIVLLSVQSGWSATLYDAAFRIRVTDEEGAPVTNAEVVATFPHVESFSPTERKQYKGFTDTNGFCAIVGKCNNPIPWRVDKDGYYRLANMKFEGTNMVAGRYEPWNPLVEVQLRRIQKPVPFLGRYVGSGILSSRDVCVPKLGQSDGFDLVKSDWVAPSGKGITTDLIIRIDSEPAKMPPDYYEKRPREGKYWNTRLMVSFANDKDGIQEFFSSPNSGSVFRSPRFAPENGYTTNLIEQENGDVYTPAKLDQNFVFRIRSQVDDKGNVTNALYGKIYGPFEYGPGGKIKFQYLLNPVPNDRNLEFDPKRNLLQHLPRGEEPRGF